MMDLRLVRHYAVCGIGFIGAGTIILRREIVRVLTTAASVWAFEVCGRTLRGARGSYATELDPGRLILIDHITKRYSRSFHPVPCVMDRKLLHRAGFRRFVT